MFVVNILETKFKLKSAKEADLTIPPTKDMHEIEAWEYKFDQQGIRYALVECRQQTKRKDVFLGYSLVTEYTLE